MKHRSIAAALALLLLPACVSSPRYPTGAESASSTSLFDLVTPGAPRWKALPDAPIARQNAAVAQLGDRVFLIGGITASGVTDRVDVFDVVTGKWSKAPTFPVKIHHASASVFSSSIWVLGGADANDRPTSSTYRLINGQWVPGPTLHHVRSAAASAVIGDSLYIFGGLGSGTALVSQTEVLKLGSSTWSIGPPIPTPRYSLAAAVRGSVAYLSGGRNASGNLATFESFDASRGSWTRLIDVPHPRNDHASVIFRGKVILLGGQPDGAEGEPPIATTDEFDPTRSVWVQTLTAMFRAKHGFGSVSSGRSIYVLGGASLSGVLPTVSCEELLTS